LPAQLPHRRRELERLLHYFEPAVRGANVSVKVHVVGPVGSGKTVLCRRAGLHIMRESEGRVKFAYVNMAYAHRPYHAVAEVHRQVKGVYPAGLSPSRGLNQRIAVEYLVDKPIQTLRKTIKQKAYKEKACLQKHVINMTDQIPYIENESLKSVGDLDPKDMPP